MAPHNDLTYVMAFIFVILRRGHRLVGRQGMKTNSIAFGRHIIDQSGKHKKGWMDGYKAAFTTR
jgi:hypothetical protein